jgi:SNF2 family DNA or RNA helicase
MLKMKHLTLRILNKLINYKKLSYDELQKWFENIDFKIKPYKHQLASMAFTIGENLKRVMFIHRIGTGKTLTALYMLKCWNVQNKILIVCPNSIMDKTWKVEIERSTDYKCNILRGTLGERLKKQQSDCQINIINYEGLRALYRKKQDNQFVIDMEAINKSGYEAIIIDECHRVKAYSIQTRICQRLTTRARYVIMLTGTPIGRDATDLFYQYWVLDNGRTFGTYYYNFLLTYFFKAYPQDFKWTPKRLCHICNKLYNHKKEHLLQHKIDIQQYRLKYPEPEHTSETIILNKVKENTITYTQEECVDLPEKIYQVREVEATSEQQELIEKVIANVPIEKLNNTNVEYHLQKILQITGGFLLKDDKILLLDSNPKLDEFKNIIEEIDGKFIVYHYYIEEGKLITEILKKKGISYAVLNGQVKNKEVEIDKFLNNPKCQVLVAHPKSGGEGLNLQLANIIIYYSNSFIGNILREQSEGRIHRIGQTKPCLYIDLVIANSVDSILLDALKNRENGIQNIIQYLKNN